MEDSTMIGARITKRREELGLSQMDLARLLDIAPARISDFERGAKTDCNLSTAKRLAQVLGVSIDYLAGTWEGEAETAPAAAPGAPAKRRGRPRSRPRPVPVP
jgi:transcriptional regulator with XRE-family HTH domain